MIATMEEAKRVKEKYESILLKKKGVVGCATGYKITEGRKIPCVVCYVTRKIPVEKLKKEDVIPGELEGVPTDVVESGDIRAL